MLSLNLSEIPVEKIEDTFAEAFSMYAARILITARDKYWAYVAGTLATGFATSIIMCPCEAGIEGFVKPSKTPDGRPGVLIQVWHNDLGLLKQQVILRVSQVVLTCPTTRVFDGLPSSRRKLSIGKTIAKFGDGFERQIEMFGKKMWAIPVMEGEFLLEDKIGVVKGVAGGNIIILARDPDGGLEAAKSAARAVRKLARRVILPFPGGVCRAGSKPGAITYPKLKASTNHPFCPTLREVVKDTKLTEDVKVVYEIVINGLTQRDVMIAMGIAAITAARHPSVIKVTAGNYGGKLGQYKLHLKECIQLALDYLRQKTGS